MIRGIAGKRIFRDTQDRKDFVTRLGDLSKQTGTRILAFFQIGSQALQEITTVPVILKYRLPFNAFWQ
jgi:hypothetical protein